MEITLLHQEIVFLTRISEREGQAWSAYIHVVDLHADAFEGLYAIVSDGRRLHAVSLSRVAYSKAVGTACRIEVAYAIAKVVKGGKSRRFTDVTLDFQPRPEKVEPPPFDRVLPPDQNCTELTVDAALLEALSRAAGKKAGESSLVMKRVEGEEPNFGVQLGYLDFLARVATETRGVPDEATATALALPHYVADAVSDPGPAVLIRFQGSRDPIIVTQPEAPGSPFAAVMPRLG